MLSAMPERFQVKTLVSGVTDKKEIKFVVDNGATDHLMKVEFENITQNKKVIKQKVSVSKRGQNINVLLDTLKCSN